MKLSYRTGSPGVAYVIAPRANCNFPPLCTGSCFVKLWLSGPPDLYQTPQTPAETMPLDSHGWSDARLPNPNRTARNAAAGLGVIDRRSAISVMAASMIVGCGDRPSGESDQPAAPPRSDVPLRILLSGTDSDAEAIRLAWSMVMEQPLAIEVVDPTTNAADDPEASFASRMMLADVAVAPQAYLGEITRAGAAVDFNETLLDEYKQQYGNPFPAVQDGLGSYGGATWGIPVGAKLLAVIALDSQVQCDTWAAYHDWVKELDGKAAEPLADGWAASSFLNRCASTFSRSWLFNRTTMKPEIASQDYVDALEQFAATAKLYTSTAMTPGEIWHAMRRGELTGGIGYEVQGRSNVADATDASQEDTEEFEVSVSSCPVETESDQLWFAPQTPLACLSTGCRQTDASKRFIGWLSGGERIAAVRQQTELFSATRSKGVNESAQSVSPYTHWLTERLQTRLIAKGLMLPEARQYHDALDKQVLRCLSGEQSAADALADAAAEWDAITDKIGRDRQTIEWKKTLGFGG